MIGRTTPKAESPRGNKSKVRNPKRKFAIKCALRIRIWRIFEFENNYKVRSRDAIKTPPKPTTLARTKQTIRKPSYNNMSVTQPTTPSIDSLLEAADAIVSASDKVEAQGVIEAKFTGAKIPLSPTIDLSGSGEAVPVGSFNS